MKTAQNIHRLELILASPFWQNDARECVMERVTLKITGHKGAYYWRMDDADEGSYKKSAPHSFVSLDAAKDSLFSVLKEGLRRLRETSTQI